MGELRAELIGTDDVRWRRLLARTTHDIYHLPGYTELSARVAGGEAFAVHAECSDAELLIPLVLRRVPELGDPAVDCFRDAVSPYGYASPLLRGTLDDATSAELGRVLRSVLAEQRVLTCFLRGHPFLARPATLLDGAGSSVAIPTIVIDLETSEEEIWRGVRGDHRDRIKRMRKRGYSLELDVWSNYAGFRTIYTETMRNVGAASTYLFDDDYFEELRAKLGEHLHLFSVMAPDRRLAAAALVTAHGGMVHGHLLGSAPEFRKDAPSLLLYDSVWRWAKARGDKWLNFGGGRGGAEDSLFEFKRGFSSLTRPVWTTRVVCAPAIYQSACRLAGVNGDPAIGFFPAYLDTAARARAASKIDSATVGPSLQAG